MPDDAKAAAGRCPRCGGAFRCGFADREPCPCTTLQLERALLQQLRARYDGCLCVACLQALARGEPVVR